MLDAHPDLAIPPETHFIVGLTRARNWSPHPRDAVVREILRHPAWPDFNLDPDDFLARLVNASRPTDVLRVFYSMYAAQQGKSRWGDKTPRYVLAMPTIAELLPEARFIHMIRDGRDVAVSIIPLWFGPASIEQAASWWKERIDVARREADARRYIEIKYESLVTNPRPELERVCTFIGLDFREEMLTSHTRAGTRLAEEKDRLDLGISAARRMQIHARVRLPPDSGAVGRWRREMTAHERHRFESLAGDTLERLGYPVD